ncbi:unnamed protein product [Lota lota]
MNTRYEYEMRGIVVEPLSLVPRGVHSRSYTNTVQQKFTVLRAESCRNDTAGRIIDGAVRRTSAPTNERSDERALPLTSAPTNERSH